jgi:hypothetical protein
MTLTLSGCLKTVVKTVKIDSFCEGKYKSLWITKKDKFNLLKLMKTSYWVTVSKYTTNTTINEKEFEFCKTIE